ncbi:unnamed protein product [Ostreobium quekettii]|uniref:NADP-dependent oxidoreductase domain-containing protein n=1 Tax=Ostreobium quekettii TaxID=121088 RepID=A0A8S1J8Y9_9CHLO|nr:unnamed protein product [Ostreobium quekettii]|eukprot:evm.model.scf_771.1 EVM.evm.TU.scf_771.1   scf_771:11186-12232(-)
MATTAGFPGGRPALATGPRKSNASNLTCSRGAVRCAANLRGTLPEGLPSLGLGTIAWGDEGYGFNTAYREKDLREAFEAAVTRGVALFDTAEVYGYKSGKVGQSAEHLLGLFAKDAEAGGQAGAFVGSKVFTIPWTNMLMGGGFRTGRKQLVEACKASVERMGGRRLDLWSIHFPFPTFGQGTLMDALEEAMDLGLTNAVGVSNYNLAQMEEAHGLLERRGIQLATNQVKYSVLSREPETSGLLDRARELGVRVVAYSPLDGGRLARRGGGDAKIAELLKLMEFIGVANGGRSAAQVALSYLVARGATPIPGVKTAGQVEAHAGAVGWGPLDENEVGVISEKVEYLGL